MREASGKMRESGFRAEGATSFAQLAAKGIFQSASTKLFVLSCKDKAIIAQQFIAGDQTKIIIESRRDG